MNKHFEVIFGFLVIIVVIAGFVVAGAATVPNKTDIANARTVKSIEVPMDIIKSGVLDKIKDLTVNGQLPVSVDNSELGRSNPFQPI